MGCEGARHLPRGPRPVTMRELGDEGVDLGLSQVALELPAFVAEVRQAFVKFFGESHNRALRTMKVLDEARQIRQPLGVHVSEGQKAAACQGRRLMFMGRMVEAPNDILIYGWARGTRHRPKEDDATEADIALRRWKEKWPHYVRVRDAEFIAGTSSNGVSLNELIAALQSDAFATTPRNATNRQGNANPRRAYLQQPAVELTAQAITGSVNDSRMPSANLECCRLPNSKLWTGLAWVRMRRLRLGVDGRRPLTFMRGNGKHIETIGNAKVASSFCTAPAKTQLSNYSGDM